MNPLYYQVRRIQAAVAALGVPTATVTHSRNGAFSAVCDGVNGAELIFDWGDGSAASTVTLLGVGTDVAANHTYGDATTKTIAVTGDLNALEKLYVESMSVESIQYAAFSSLERISFYGNNDISVSGLAGPPLTFAYLGFCSNLSDISSVEDTTTLQILFARDNSIIDISPVIGLYSLTNLQLQDNPVTYPPGGLSWFTATYGIFRFNSTVTTAAEVDQWLIDLAAAGWSNCTVYLDGTNPARTSASDAAILTLIGNGVTVNVNE